jgi:cell wall-associated NlpC family hydrolase
MRALVTAALCCTLFPASSAAAGGTSRSWAQAQIKLVTRHEMFLGTPSAFRPQDPLTAGTLARVVARLTGTPAKQPRDPAAQVSMASLDAALVNALGLRDSAAAFYQGARSAGLRPPAYFGTEVMARMLGLRLNHPTGEEELELRPEQAATRAEAAYSVAAILHFHRGADYGGARAWHSRQGRGSYGNGRSTSSATAPSVFAASWEVGRAKEIAQSFALPDLTVWQGRVLQTAVSLIGGPYVWGGTSESGMDCSGFVWRVYKLTSYAGAPQLAGVLRGRTTMEMSGEVPKTRRVAMTKLQPGDVLFFGNGPKSAPSQVDHTGIYLGNGWFINSSRYGVAISLLGSDDSRFAWARRPLAEAGLR